MYRRPRPRIKTVERPPGWKPNINGATSLAEFIREIVFDKEPGDLILTSNSLRKISLRDQRDAKRHRPRNPTPPPESGFSELIDRKRTKNLIERGNLCKYCELITISRLTAAANSDSRVASDDLGGHHHTPHELETSALSCPLCRLFVIAFGSGFRTLKQITTPRTTAPHRGKCRFKIWARNTYLDSEKKDIEDLNILVLEWIDGKSEHIAELLMLADYGSDADVKGKLSVQRYSPSLDRQALSRILPQLLRQCHENHDHCQGSIFMRPDEIEIQKSPYTTLREAKLPSRVVVTEWEKHGRTGPFLLETKGRYGVYATLSHCWGNPDLMAKTTRLNLSANFESLSIDPSSANERTVHEAIDVCRLLRIPYIWIDSFCIVQHDPSDPKSNLNDWTWEALDMGRIYKDSALTIAATGASDNPSNGFYGDRLALAQYVQVPFRMDAEDEPDDTNVFYVALKPRGFEDEVSNSHLYTRGWVLQERLLSPRYLHFGKDQWFWQCRELTLAELPGFEDGETTVGADIGMTPTLLKDDVKFTKWWMKVVETYTRLNFTVQSDRHVALQGLINEILRIKPQEQFYGMWSNMLYVQLMWHKDRESSASGTSAPRNNSSGYYSPSWSWMSINAPISHHDTTDAYNPSYESLRDKLFDYPELKFVRPMMEHKFSQATSHGGSVLVIRAQIQGAAISGSLQLERLRQRDHAADHDRLGPIQQMARGTYDRNHHYTQLQATVGPLKGQIVGKCTLDEEAYRRLKTIACIRVSDSREVELGREKTYSIDLLLVYPTKTTSGSVLFRRIGTGKAFKTNWFDGCRTTQFTMA